MNMFAKKTITTTLHQVIIGVCLMSSVAYANEPTHLAQEISQSISKAAVDSVPSHDGRDDDVIFDNSERLPDDSELAVLNNSKDPLVGIDGLHPTRVPLNAISPDTLKTFVSAVDLVRRQHITDVNDEELFKNAISGMLSRLDSHAEFLDADALSNLQSFTDGNIANIGMMVNFDPIDGYWVVSRVEKNSPASLADITKGDYIHQINDIKLNESKSQNDVEQLLNGIAGTQIELVVSKAGRSKRTVYLQRNHLQTSNLDVQMHQGIAVVRVPVFQNNTRQQLVESLIRINTPIQGMILDLRNNPGGVLESAISIASLFVEDTPLVQVVDRTQSQTIAAFHGASLANMPLIILQNRYSASAAEVLAAGLQFNQRATIMGETSYGKGSVQSVIPIDNDQAIKLTTAYYQKPNGDKIDGVGISPNIELKHDESMWLIYALEQMRSQKLEHGIIMSVSNDY